MEPVSFKGFQQHRAETIASWERNFKYDPCKSLPEDIRKMFTDVNLWSEKVKSWEEMLITEEMQYPSEDWPLTREGLKSAWDMNISCQNNFYNK